MLYLFNNWVGFDWASSNAWSFIRVESRFKTRKTTHFLSPKRIKYVVIVEEMLRLSPAPDR